MQRVSGPRRGMAGAKARHRRMGVDQGKALWEPSAVTSRDANFASSDTLAGAPQHRRHEMSRGVMQILMLLQTAQLTHSSAADCIGTVKLVFPRGGRVLTCRGAGVCKDILRGCSRYGKSNCSPHKGFKTVSVARLCAWTPQGFLTPCLRVLPHSMASSTFLQLFLPPPLTSVRKEGNRAEATADLTHG